MIFLPLGSEVMGAIFIFDVPPEHGSGERFTLAGVPLLMSISLRYLKILSSSSLKTLPLRGVEAETVFLIFLTNGSLTYTESK